MISKLKIGVLLLVLVVLGWSTVNQQKDWNGWKTPDAHSPIINSDGSGYYAYLPLAFIYQDVTFSFIDSLKKVYPEGKFDQFSQPDAEGRRFDKFFIGTAILQTPFFLFAHYFHPAQFPSDGYSYPYYLSVAVATGFYLLLGIFLLGLLLYKLKFSVTTIVMTTLVMSFGSPLYYYTIHEPSLSHVYSFAMITAFALSLYMWVKEGNAKMIGVVALLYGLIMVLRPVNGLVCLAFFFFFPNLKEAFSFLGNQLTKNVIRTFTSLLLFALPILLQCLSVYSQTGHFAFNLYGDEGFDHLTNPFISEVLFGIRKGLFIYAPICLFALVTPFFLWKKNKSLAISSSLFFLIFTYFTASWWCWWYGGSLGMRPFVDITVLFAVALAFLIEKSAWWLKLLWAIVVTLCIYYQFVLSYQMRVGILHYDGLSKEQYEKVFLKKDRRFEWMYFVGPVFEIPKEAAKTNELSWSNSQQTFVPSSKAETLTISEPVNKLIYIIPSDSLRPRYVRLTADCLIDDPMNIPKFQLFQSKDGQLKEVGFSMFGMQVSKTDEFTPIRSDFEVPTDLDSLVLHLEVSHGGMRMRGLKMGFYR